MDLVQISALASRADHFANARFAAFSGPVETSGAETQRVMRVP